MPKKPTKVPFVHLHNHTEMSFLDGVTKIKDIVAKAKSEGMTALAITDHGNMYGALKFYNECKRCDIKPIIGCEIYVTNDTYPADGSEPAERNRDNYHLILLAENNTGYHNLIKIVSEATEHFYYRPRATKEMLRKYSEGLIALTACLSGELCRAIATGGYDAGKKIVDEYVDIFGRDNLYLEIQKHNIPDEARIYPIVIQLAKDMDMKVVATNDIHYIDHTGAKAQDILFCVQSKKKLSDDDRMKSVTSECYFKSAEEMYVLFKDGLHCMSNTVEIANRCNVELKMKQDLAPHFPSVPEGETESSYLRKLCEDAITKKYPTDGISLDVARKRMDYELGVIDAMGYSGYFLVVWDFILWARQNGIIIGPGRGSGAGSIVCYLTDITQLEPISLGLLFERFLNPERVSMPDIDTDIADYGRDAVAEYMMERYGYDKSAKITTFQSMAAKAAVRDTARAMGLPYADADEIAKAIPFSTSIDKALEESDKLKLIYDSNESAREVLDMARVIEGLPRQHGAHAAGLVISEVPLKDVIPVSYEKNDKTKKMERVTAFDKDEVEKIGLLKMDLLGLINLSIIRDAKNFIKERRNVDVNLDYGVLPQDDKKTTNMLTRGETLGVFQLESEGMTNLVRKLAPKNYRDLIPLVALYRPGPLGSGMVDDFINCRHGKQKIKYMHPWLEPILKETYGVILYQEQVMQIVQTLGNFTLGEADVMRRAMGHKEEDLLRAQEDKFVAGCKFNNISEELARKIFNLMLQFASYGFNKSHSAAYAYIAYQTAYLKANYPVEYMSAYATNMIGKDDKFPRIKATCSRMKIDFLPLDINKSDYGFVPDGKSIRIGFGAIKGVGDAITTAILEERKKNGNFKSAADLLWRVPKISNELFKKMCFLGAFKEIEPQNECLCYYYQDIYDGMKAFNKAHKDTQKKNENAISLFSDVVLEAAQKSAPETSSFFKKDKMNNYERSKQVIVADEFEYYGFYVTAHPLDGYEDYINKSVRMSAVASYVDRGKWEKQWNITLCAILTEFKIITTKKGEQMAFVKLATPDDITVDCVIFPNSFKAIEKETMLLPNNIYFVEQGKLNLRDGKVQVAIEKIKKLN